MGIGDSSHSPEGEAGAREALSGALKKGKLGEARKIHDELGGTAQEFLTAVVRDANIMDASELVEAMDEAERAEFLALPETKAAAKAAIMRDLEKRTIDGVLLEIKLYELSSEELDNTELQAAAQNSAMETLKRGNHKGFFRLVDTFHLSDEFLASDSMSTSTKEGMQFLLSRQSRPEELAAELAKAFAEKGLGHLVQGDKAIEE